MITNLGSARLEVAIFFHSTISVTCRLVGCKKTELFIGHFLISSFFSVLPGRVEIVMSDSPMFFLVVFSKRWVAPPPRCAD